MKRDVLLVIQFGLLLVLVIMRVEQQRQLYRAHDQTAAAIEVAQKWKRAAETYLGIPR